MSRVSPEFPPSLPAPTGPPPPGSRTVTTDDGVPLHVEVDGDESGQLTVVLSHGFTARLAEWELQRAALRKRARLVLWDQRGHGRSGWTPLPDATIVRTGRDLVQVLLEIGHEIVSFLLGKVGQPRRNRRDVRLHLKIHRCGRHAAFPPFLTIASITSAKDAHRFVASSRRSRPF